MWAPLWKLFLRHPKLEGPQSIVVRAKTRDLAIAMVLSSTGLVAYQARRYL